MRRVGVFGWGVIAPRSPDIDAFARNLESADSWLSPFDGFGPDTFLVGEPDFRFADYRPWVEDRFPPARFSQLESKMGLPAQLAIGAFIQALGQNEGLEAELKRLGTRTHVYVGTGLGDLKTISDQALAKHAAQRRWNRFWADPARNPALRDHLAGRGEADPDMPPAPGDVPDRDLDGAEEAWWAYWAARSSELRAYLEELCEIEGLGVEGEVATGKLAVLKEKRRRLRKLRDRVQCPDPPWECVSQNLIWNIHNIPAAQISMLGGLRGMAISPVAACSTFGVALKMALDAIQRGDATAVVVGACDPPPSPLAIGAFYNAKVLAADGRVSQPLTQLKGTHVAGGSVVWIVGDMEHMRSRGFRPLGMEPVAVGVTSDADHIITPSEEGPSEAMRLAFERSGTSPDQVGSWDLHATATPGDWSEIRLIRKLVPADTLVTARKGTFGHGMSAGGGWELTAQYLGYEKGVLFPTPLRREELNPEIARLHERFVFDTRCEAPAGLAGKLSMGIGGINACVLSRALGD